MSILDRLWPSAYAEASNQIQELKNMCLSPVWHPEEINRAYRIFHTMKSTMAMVKVNSMEQVFFTCEHFLRNISDTDLPLDSNATGLLAEIADWAGIWLDKAYYDRQPPTDEKILIERISALEIS